MSLIKEVWSHNLVEEIREICDIVEKYPYIGMDTEFPGVIHNPNSFQERNAFHLNNINSQYELIRQNVNQLKIIQIGLTFTDENGNLPNGTSTWQFNFQFDLKKDQYAQDSINLLKNSGIDFEKFKKDGIVGSDFAELITTSGAVLSDSVTWISYHSCYDFGYLYRILTNLELPKKLGDFLEDLVYYFPVVYDIKYIAKAKFVHYGGLQDLAETLKVERIGPQHQAGSDSLLTSKNIFLNFENNIYKEHHLKFIKNKIYDFVEPPQTRITNPPNLTYNTQTPYWPPDSHNSHY